MKRRSKNGSSEVWSSHSATSSYPSNVWLRPFYFAAALRASSPSPVEQSALTKGDEMEPLGVKPNAAFEAIGCGKTKGWELVRDGELETFKIGAATRVTTESVRAYVERQISKQREAA